MRQSKRTAHTETHYYDSLFDRNTIDLVHRRIDRKEIVRQDLRQVRFHTMTVEMCLHRQVAHKQFEVRSYEDIRQLNISMHPILDYVTHT